MTKFKQSLLGIGLLASSGFVFANDALTCSYTTKFKDTLKVIRQDRPVTINHTENTFGFSWSAREYPTDASWEFEVDLTNALQVQVRLRRVVYDDNMYIYVNGQEIFGRVGGGVNGFDANLDVGRYFKDGVNTIRVRLVNDIPQNAAIGATFEYSEGGCIANELPRPPVPKMQDLQRCVTEDICTKPFAKQNHAGLTIERGCWEYTTVRTCYDFLEDETTCKETPRQGGSCEVVSKECLNENEYTVGNNKFKGCTLYETKTRCTVPTTTAEMTPEELATYNKENSERQLACKPVQTCVGDDCYITATERDKPDEDMPYILALLEIGNQAGTYMTQDSIRLFDGVQSKCRSRRGFGALASCCEGGNGPVPTATNSKGQQVTATSDNTYANTFESLDAKYSDPTASANEDFKQGGGNAYTYDALYAPNEARYMLQGTQSVSETDAGKEAFANGGASKLTAMGYGWSETGTGVGDQVTFGEYSQKNKSGTNDD